jgi:hypothetical protein
MKFDLPVVKDAKWLKEYKPSGICPPGAKWRMLVSGILIGTVIGVVAYYGGILTSGLAKLVFIVFGVVALCGGIFGWISIALSTVAVIIFLGLGYPALLGYILGSSIWPAAKAGKCRNSGLTAGIGFLSGVIAYGVFAWMAIRFGSIHETSWLTKMLPGLSSTSGWMILILVVDALTLVVVTTATARSGINDNPFCEECQKWYGMPIEVSYSVKIYDPDFAKQLVLTLESGIPQNLKVDLRLPSDATTPRITLSLQRCTCGQADYKLSTTLNWQESRVEKGKHYYDKDTIKIEEKSEDWFKTMIPPGLGRQLETILFAEPASTELKSV